jgi:tetratricopeptide (TPR) repeat protein
MTAQAMLAAHVTEAPEPVTRHRPAVPEGLSALILRCLEKKAADRPQRAEELLSQVEAMTTPTGGMTPAGTQPVISSGTAAAIERAHPVRVAGLFGLASVGVLAIAYALVQLIGLPDWVFYGAIGLLAVGLPIMLLTGHHERRRALAHSSGPMTATPAGGLQQQFTWRNALLGGGVAFAGLGVTATGYMALRLLGIGPIGTLVARGSFEKGDTVVLADFVDRTDRGLGVTFTEAFRIDLSQSSVLQLMPAGDVRSALRRMDRDPASGLGLEVARDVAVRQGAAAVLAGEISAAGGRYLLAVQLVAPETGNLIAAFRETAADSSDIIDAIDRLSRTTRERVGESLRSIRAGPRLAAVTTASLPALRKYTQAMAVQGDMLPRIRLLQEAVSLDSTFAEAYRTLGVTLSNRGLPTSQIVDAVTRAYRHRHRLPEETRLLVEGTYFATVGDLERSNEAYRALLDINPRRLAALNNMGVNYRVLRQPERAAELFARAVEISPDTSPNSLFLRNLLSERAQLGDTAWVDSVVQRHREIAPKPLYAATALFLLRLQRGDRGTARAELEAYRREVAGDPDLNAITGYLLAALAGMEGRRQERAALLAGATPQSVRTAGGSSAQTLQVIRRTLHRANYDVALGHLVNEAIREVDDTLARHSLDELHPFDRPYADLAAFYARAGRPERAEALLLELSRAEKQAFADSTAFGHWDRRIARATAEGWVALSRGRAAQAVEAFRRADIGPCWYCALPALAMAYDAAGESDSALAVLERYVLERYVMDPGRDRVFTDETELRGALWRLAELWEQKGNHEKAIDYYTRFVELWKNADPELQPMVSEVKGRLARLVGERR